MFFTSRFWTTIEEHSLDFSSLQAQLHLSSTGGPWRDPRVLGQGRGRNPFVRMFFTSRVWTTIEGHSLDHLSLFFASGSVRIMIVPLGGRPLRESTHFGAEAMALHQHWGVSTAIQRPCELFPVRCMHCTLNRRVSNKISLKLSFARAGN